MNKKLHNKINPQRKRTKQLALGLTFIFAVGMLSGCAKSSKTPDLITPASESLQSVEAKKKNVKKTAVFTGYVTGEEKGYFFKESKENLEYKVSLGDKVTKGQALVVADGSELESELEDLQLQLTGVKAEISYLKEYGKLNQDKLTIQKKNATADEKEMAENELERAKIDQEYQEQLLNLQISNLSKQITEIQKKIDENTLYAEKEGYVSFLGFQTYAFEFVNVVVVMDTNNLHIALKSDMSKEQAEKYQRAYVNYNGSEIDLSEIEYTEIQKKVAQRSAMVLPPQFKIADKKMKLGECLAVHVVMEENENALAVPKTCIYESENGDYVYRIKGKNKEKCFVEIGIQGNVETEIKSGVKEGDMIYYPVDDKIKYSKETKLKKETVSIKGMEVKCRLINPKYQDVRTGVGEATLEFITDQTQVKKGDLLATVSLTAGVADIKDVENQISSLNKQYSAQKTMHEKTIKLLNKEINSLQRKKGSSTSSQMKPVRTDVNEVLQMGTLAGGTSEITTENSTIQEASSETATTEEKKEEKPKEQETESDETSDDEPRKYPVSVQIALKKVELSMEKLSQTHDKENYDRQIKLLNKSLESLKKKTGTINLYAPCDGEVNLGYDVSYIGRMISENASVVTLKNTEFSYVGIANKENSVKYGERIVVRDEEGKEHAGTVVGAYPSGTMNVSESDSDGSYMTFYSEPDENQMSAYVELDDGTKVENGTMVIKSDDIKDVISVDKDAIKREGDYHYVWILREGKPYKQYVEYMMVADDKAWVFDGLSEDDTLLTGVK